MYTYAKIQSTALHLFEPLSRADNFLGILQKPQINYFSKTSLDGYFLLNQYRSKVEQSGGLTMAQNTGKSDFFFALF